MKFAKNLLAVFIILAFIVSCSRSADQVGSPERAKEILEKTVNKYSDLLEKEGKDIKSFIAKTYIKGAGQLPMGNAGNMPLSIDSAVEIYATKPQNFYLDISGNIGNAKIIVKGKDKPSDKTTATIILPGTKQFAIMDVPQQLNPAQNKPQEPAQKVNRMEDILKRSNLEYGGSEKSKQGKVHKIIIKSKDPADQSIVNAYILDRKWDPQKFEFISKDGGKIDVMIEKLEINARIPDNKFTPETTGYTQITNQQMTAAIMMQIMTSMMQQGGQSK